ncbi:DEAD/DEAH box helicase [Nostoc sp. UHCC 0702]|nr:DEAD/DEAH box helicase [Nostoc sp. UHCC 0702]
MSWMVPFHKLDPEQRNMINQIRSNPRRNHWIKGFVGSGKSVVLVHTLIQLKTSNPRLNVCLALFTHSLIAMFETGIPEEIKKNLRITTCESFRNKPEKYDLIIVDEVQDLSPDVLELMEKYSQQLIVAGDSDQSIYEDRVTPQQIEKLINPMIHELTILHRLTNKIIDIARVIFPDNRLEKAKRSRLENVDVTLGIAQKIEEEVGYVWDQASEYLKSGVITAILFSKKIDIVQFVNLILATYGYKPWNVKKNNFNDYDFNDFNTYLKTCNLPIQYLGNGHGNLNKSSEEFKKASKVYLMTYHSAKGLDFETVFLPILNSQNKIWSKLDKAKNLLFVAMTRSRLNLFITYTGTPNSDVKQIPNNLLRTIYLPLNKNQARGNKNETIVEDDDDFIF